MTKPTTITFDKAVFHLDSEVVIIDRDEVTYCTLYDEACVVDVMIPVPYNA